METSRSEAEWLERERELLARNTQLVEQLRAPRLTIHTYTCGCQLTDPYDGVTEEIHNHPCSNHGGHA